MIKLHGSINKNSQNSKNYLFNALILAKYYFLQKMKLKFNILLLVVLAFSFSAKAQLSFENKFERPLGAVLNEISERFKVRFSYEIDTVGKKLPFADSRIRAYSLEETLTNVLVQFDYKFVKQNDSYYKLKTYEHHRRTEDEGKKMLDFLSATYSDKNAWESRRACLKSEIREKLGIDKLLSKRVNSKPILSKIRKFDGYTVQNFALETLPGLYTAGSIYTPASKGNHALIINPNGHFGQGRYREDQQQRMATMARMGAVCVSYDLFGYGESALQVGSAAHRSSAAHVIQLMNGITILDYMLTRKNIDKNRIGASGGSGGGTQTILLSALDDRFTAIAPVVMLSSYFDGGCPCESGLPVTASCGGTNNAEIGALFAPKPMLVVSDGKDWTATVADVEFPYLKNIYRFYNAENNVKNVHLPEEGHDFGINKRKAVYDFFASEFSLDKSKLDEKLILIEPEDALKSFGEKGEFMPVNAIRSFDALSEYFDKKSFTQLRSDVSLEKKAQEWAGSLNLTDEKNRSYVNTLIYNHLRQVRDWHNQHPYTSVPEGINPLTGNKLTKLDREMIASSAKPKEIHETLMDGLRKVLTKEQIEQILDKYTVGKVAFTLNGYKAIVPDLTPNEEDFILTNLKQAREEAIDYKNMNQISAVFEIYKTKCENYLIANGRNWRELYKDFVKKVNEEKEAKKKLENNDK